MKINDIKNLPAAACLVMGFCKQQPGIVVVSKLEEIKDYVKIDKLYEINNSNSTFPVKIVFGLICSI
jgi:hypothetical protein